MTAFTSYGLFWWSLVLLIIFSVMDIGEATPPAFMGWYLLLWEGIYRIYVLWHTGCCKLFQFVFASRAVLFFLLAARDFTGSTFIVTITGFEGIICGTSVIYLAMVEVCCLSVNLSLLTARNTPESRVCCVQAV